MCWLSNFGCAVFPPPPPSIYSVVSESAVSYNILRFCASLHALRAFLGDLTDEQLEDFLLRRLHALEEDYARTLAAEPGHRNGVNGVRRRI